MAAALTRVQGGMLARLTAALAAVPGRRAGPAATALRLTALQDGLAGLLLAGTPDLTPEMAEAHLRRAFALEVG